jgi:hypothetical protein
MVIRRSLVIFVAGFLPWPSSGCARAAASSTGSPGRRSPPWRRHSAIVGPPDHRERPLVSTLYETVFGPPGAPYHRADHRAITAASRSVLSCSGWLFLANGYDCRIK